MVRFESIAIVDRTLVALDLETTGLSPRLDRIIEVGAVRFQGDEVLATFQSLVRPEVGIPRAVQELTGIRDADVARAPQPEEVLAQLIDFVGTSGVVAHSGNFDLSFLVDGDAQPAYVLFDTLDLSRIMLPAVLMTYAFGLLLAGIPGVVDWRQGWIWAKLGLVFDLFMFHRAL